MSMYVKAVSVVMLLLAIFIAPVRAGDPVPGLDISLEQIPGIMIRTTQTDEEGRYVFKKVDTGTYKIRFDFTDFDDTLVEGQVDYNSSRPNVKLIVRVYDPLDTESEESGRYFKTMTIIQSRLGQIKGQITEDVTVGTGTVKIFMKNRERNREKYKNRRKGEMEANEMR
mgnify:CR=1 FL=1